MSRYLHPQFTHGLKELSACSGIYLLAQKQLRLITGCGLVIAMHDIAELFETFAQSLWCCERPSGGLCALSLPRDGVLVVVGRDVDVRVELIGFRGRLIRREVRNRGGRRVAALVPTLVERDVVGEIGVELFDLPHATLFRVFILVDGVSPLRSLMKLAHLHECAPACLGRGAVRLNRDDRLQLDVVENRAVGEVGQLVEIGADVVLSFVNAAQTDFESAILGEKIGDFVPFGFVDVVAVGILEIADVDVILRTLDLPRELRDLSLQRRDLGGKVFGVVASAGKGQHGTNQRNQNQDWQNRDFHVRCLLMIGRKARKKADKSKAAPQAAPLRKSKTISKARGYQSITPAARPSEGDTRRVYAAGRIAGGKFVVSRTW